MNRQKKAHGASVGTGKETAKSGQLFNVNYSIIDTKVQDPPFNPAASALLDQAIMRIEHHLALARKHYALANQHKKIKAALESQFLGGAT